VTFLFDKREREKREVSVCVCVCVEIFVMREKCVDFLMIYVCVCDDEECARGFF